MTGWFSASLKLPWSRSVVFSVVFSVDESQPTTVDLESDNVQNTAVTAIGKLPVVADTRDSRIEGEATRPALDCGRHVE